MDQEGLWAGGASAARAVQAPAEARSLRRVAQGHIQAGSERLRGDSAIVQPVPGLSLRIITCISQLSESALSV